MGRKALCYHLRLVVPIPFFSKTVWCWCCATQTWMDRSIRPNPHCWNIWVPAMPQDLWFVQSHCTHALKKHGVLNLVHRYTASNVCRSCLRTYATREQTVHHLKYWRTGCLAKLIATVNPLTDTEVEAVLEEQRQLRRKAKTMLRPKHHKLPVCAGYGPLRPWPWTRSTNLVSSAEMTSSSDIASHTQWLQEVFEAAKTGNSEATLAALQLSLSSQPVSKCSTKPSKTLALKIP